MKNRFHWIITIVLSVLLSYLITSNILKMNGERVKNIDTLEENTNLKKVSQIEEVRKMSMNTDNKFIIDINKMSYQTDENGNFEGTGK